MTLDELTIEDRNVFACPQTEQRLSLHVTGELPQTMVFKEHSPGPGIHDMLMEVTLLQPISKYVTVAGNCSVTSNVNKGLAVKSRA